MYMVVPARKFTSNKLLPPIHTMQSFIHHLNKDKNNSFKKKADTNINLEPIPKVWRNTCISIWSEIPLCENKLFPKQYILCLALPNPNKIQAYGNREQKQSTLFSVCSKIRLGSSDESHIFAFLSKIKHIFARREQWKHLKMFIPMLNK